MLGLGPAPYKREDACTLPSKVPGTSLALSTEIRELVTRMLAWEARKRPSALTAVAWLHVRARMLVRKRDHAIEQAYQGASELEPEPKSREQAATRCCCCPFPPTKTGAGQATADDQSQPAIGTTAGTGTAGSQSSEPEPEPELDGATVTPSAPPAHLVLSDIQSAHPVVAELPVTQRQRTRSSRAAP
jgi:hypothetical protein